jgi:ketosteroid isomerase-like protein
MALNERLLPFHLQTRLLRQFEAGEDVCSIYEMDLPTPAGDTLTVEMADWIQVKDGRIRHQRIYYDPREFADALGM